MVARDLRFAFRQLTKSPGYALAVMLTLALDFLSRRFGSGRLRRHPGRPGPASAGDRHGELVKEPPASIQQIHQKEDVDV